MKVRGVYVLCHWGKGSLCFPLVHFRTSPCRRWLDMVLRIIGFGVPSRCLGALLFPILPKSSLQFLNLNHNCKVLSAKTYSHFWGHRTWPYLGADHMGCFLVLLISLGAYREKQMTRPNSSGFPLTYRDIFPPITP